MLLIGLVVGILVSSITVQAGTGVWAYWTSINHENLAVDAWIVNFWNGNVDLAIKEGNPQVLGFVWSVRGSRAA